MAKATKELGLLAVVVLAVLGILSASLYLLYGSVSAQMAAQTQALDEHERAETDNAQAQLRALQEIASSQAQTTAVLKELAGTIRETCVSIAQDASARARCLGRGGQ